MFGGSRSSMPYLKIVCVCPPQTSINLSGGSPIRAESRAISPASRLAISPLRYSSRYFISRFLHCSVNLNGGSLWSAVAWNRFGSHLRVLQTSGTGDTSGLPFNHCQSIEVDYQSGSKQPHSKGSADPIYAHASFC